MATFTVTKKETFVSTAQIEARDEKHALQLARALDGTEQNVEYTGTERTSLHLSIPGYSPRKEAAASGTATDAAPAPKKGKATSLLS